MELSGCNPAWQISAADLLRSTSVIAHNRCVTLQGEQFAIEEVEVVTATVDLDEVVSWRGKNSSQREQASAAPR